MDVWAQIALTSLTTIVASSGFWAYIISKNSSKSATDRLLMGIAYDKITSYGLAYLERGWVTMDEYEELQKYYYEPYKDLGGNGTAEQIMDQVRRLPFRHSSKYAGVLPVEERFINNVRVVASPSAE